MSFTDQIESYWTNRELLKEESAKNFIQRYHRRTRQGQDARGRTARNGGWIVNEALKKAIILYFPIQQMHVSEVGIFEYHDKMKLKTGYDKLGVRVVPPAVADMVHTFQKELC
jgi:2,3,4,5-tetrahydropyridine-2-carboxylate N-succinyltransferase